MKPTLGLERARSRAPGSPSLRQQQQPKRHGCRVTQSGEPLSRGSPVVVQLPGNGEVVVTIKERTNEREESGKAETRRKGVARRCRGRRPPVDEERVPSLPVAPLTLLRFSRAAGQPVRRLSVHFLSPRAPFMVSTRAHRESAIQNAYTTRETSLTKGLSLKGTANKLASCGISLGRVRQHPSEYSQLHQWPAQSAK